MPDDTVPEDPVYIEEGGPTPPVITGVRTDVAGFAGPTRTGPVAPCAVTSFSGFTAIYGSAFDPGSSIHTFAQSVRAFFAEGGRRLHVARVLGAGATTARSGTIAGSDVHFRARFPGAGGNGRVRLRLARRATTARALARAPEGTVARVSGAERYDAVKRGDRWEQPDGTRGDLTAGEGTRLHRLSLSAWLESGEGGAMVYQDLGLDAEHPRWIGKVLGEASGEEIARRTEFHGEGAAAFDLLRDLFPTRSTTTVSVDGGTDGGEPGVTEYEAALALLADIEEIAVVAAPGYSVSSAAGAIQNALMAHAEGEGAYRMAVIDTPPGLDPEGALAWRGTVDSRHASLYYPWVVSSEATLPPSGFVCGMYARNDAERGVHKAPADLPVRSALRLERNVTAAEQEVLNPAGINCLRSFPGRGCVVWGARVATSDPEWKYVPVRRYLAYLEHSIDRGTQWAVFEPNDEPLWATVRVQVEAFLFDEWRKGALVGQTPTQAYFVRCDRTTMTQEDIDRGRLVCLVGVAVVKAAEFVIFRIGQWTAVSG